LENCERYTLRSLVRRSAKHHAEVTVDHAKRVFSRALKKLDTSQGHNPTLRAMIVYLLKQEPLEANSQPSGNTRGYRGRMGLIIRSRRRRARAASPARRGGAARYGPPSEFLLSKMKIAVVVRQLDRDHIVWRGRVVRVERAHRIRVVRGVQKMLDVGRHGVIEFGQIWFVAHDHVVTYVFRKGEFVGCCVAHHRARDIESLGKVWRSRSMSPARATQQRRQNRRIVWDDRARMGAAIICELEVSQLGYIGIIELRGQMKQLIGVVLGEVDFRIGNMVQVCLEEESRAITVAAQHLS